MSSSGLTRRRGAAAGSSDGGEGSSTPGRANSSSNFKDGSGAPETSYENGENGHKIAFDPRDISESAERSKQPKLTLMEEVLLLGLKDKQVRFKPPVPFVGGRVLGVLRMGYGDTNGLSFAGLPLVLERQHLVRA